MDPQPGDTVPIAPSTLPTRAAALEVPRGRVKSPWRIVGERLLRNRPALFGGGVLLLLYTVAVFTDFFSPYSPYTSTASYEHPPHAIRFVDMQGNFHLRPFIYRYQLVDFLRREYVVDVSQRYPIEWFVRGPEYEMWGLFSSNLHLFGVDAPEGTEVRIHLLGTDRAGRDLLSRLIFGARISLSIGLIGIMVSMSLGMIIGGISGYFGGFIDNALMRLVELMMSVPGLYLILALRTGLSENQFLRSLFRLQPEEPFSSGQIYILIVAILGLIGWGGTARVIRGMVLSVREYDYVNAARALGASRRRQILLHVLPNTLTYVIVAATLSVPAYILGEVALSFLGVGITDPTPSWGLMLQDAQSIAALTKRTWVLAPGVMIFITVFAYNFLGDGLRDALDPKAME